MLSTTLLGFVTFLVSAGALPVGGYPQMDQTLIPAGATWRYLDAGSDPGTSWRESEFDDSMWRSGDAPLGYGDEVMTRVSYGADPDNKAVTTYFRHAVTIADPTHFSWLRLRLMRDDGAAVYINGREVWRSNMLSGEIARGAHAASFVADNEETAWYEKVLDQRVLVPGLNVIAVEVHQDRPTSSDIRFDFEMIGSTSATMWEEVSSIGPDTAFEERALVPVDATWRYLDDGSDPGARWHSLGPDDGAWKVGRAKLGYGDSDVETVVGFGPDPKAKIITTYFRHVFVVDGPATFRFLKVRMMRDDGAVVYINGSEVWRSNMPGGLVTTATHASVGVGSSAEVLWHDTTLANPLVSGRNVVAVEVHQAEATSSDLGFALQLVGTNRHTLAVHPPDPEPFATWRGALSRDSEIFAADYLAASDPNARQAALRALVLRPGYNSSPVPAIAERDSVAWRFYKTAALTDPAANVRAMLVVNALNSQLPDSIVQRFLAAVISTETHPTVFSMMYYRFARQEPFTGSAALMTKIHRALGRTLSEAPYVRWSGDTAAIVLAVCNDSLHGATVPVTDKAASIANPCGGAVEGTLRLPPPSTAPAQAVLSGVSRIFAVSDVWGEYGPLVELLQAAQIIDSERRWAWGDGHIVLVGDVVGRGEGVTETLWLIRRLEEEANQAGGRVHLVLGDREVELLSGLTRQLGDASLHDHRWVADKYFAVAHELGIPLLALYGPTTELGRWLRHRPAVLRIDSLLFVHGGVSPMLAERGLDMDVVNANVRAGLFDPASRMVDSTTALVFDQRRVPRSRAGGPFTYVGYFEDPSGPDIPAQLDFDLRRLLAHYGAKTIVVGHSMVDKVSSMHDGQVIAINARYGKRSVSEGLLIDEGKGYRVAADGQPRSVPVVLRSPERVAKPRPFADSSRALVRRDQTGRGPITDGPYVLWHGDTAATVLAVCSDSVSQSTVDVTEGTVQIAHPCPAVPQPMLHLTRSPDSPPAATSRGAPRVFAVSDVEGDYDVLVELLRAAGVIDREHRWAWGDGHLVFVGDVVDRGTEVTEVLWLIYRLEQEAARAGGRVHVVLGNHEAMLLSGDHRYVDRKYVAAQQHLGLGLRELYAPNTELGRWLRSKPAMMRIDSLLFVHGGISPTFAAHRLDIERVNREVRAGLTDLARQATDSVTQLIFASDGPLWFRDNVRSADTTTEARAQLTRDLERYGATSVVVGHTVVDSVQRIGGGPVIAIDVTFNDPQRAEGLLVERGEYHVMDISGARRPLR